MYLLMHLPLAINFSTSQYLSQTTKNINAYHGSAGPNNV